MSDPKRREFWKAYLHWMRFEHIFVPVLEDGVVILSHILVLVLLILDNGMKIMQRHSDWIKDFDQQESLI